MANKLFEQFSLSLIKKKVDLGGVISLSAAGAVVSSSIEGVASVAKTGTGAYLITLSDKYPSFKFGSVSLAESAQNLEAKLGAVSSSAKTVVFNTKVNGVDTDATATCKIYVHLCYSNSSV